MGGKARGKARGKGRGKAPLALVGAVGAVGQGIPNSPIPGIPGAWYWQHDVPGYRGREEAPSPIPLSDQLNQYRFHLAWEAGFMASQLHGQLPQITIVNVGMC